MAKLFGLGFGYFYAPAFRTLSGKLIPENSLRSLSWKTTFSFVKGGCDQVEKEGKKETENLGFDFESSSIE